MQNLPDFNRLNNDLSDSFFPSWIDEPLTHLDKVLLTIRMIHGVDHSPVILPNLSVNGLAVYNSIFSFAELPDEALYNAILLVDNLEQLIKLRAANVRIMRISDKLIPELHHKFAVILNENPKLGSLNEPIKMNTFEDLTQWYEESFFDTPHCAQHFYINRCVDIAISTKNLKRLKLLINPSNERYLIESVIEAKHYDWVPELIKNVKIENLTVYFLRSRVSDPKFDDMVREIYQNLDFLTSNELAENLDKIIKMIRTAVLSTKKNDDRSLFFMHNVDLIFPLLLEVADNLGYDISEYKRIKKY